MSIRTWLKGDSSAVHAVTTEDVIAYLAARARHGTTGQASRLYMQTALRLRAEAEEKLRETRADKSVDSAE
jgi:hypothetical protein